MAMVKLVGSHCCKLVVKPLAVSQLGSEDLDKLLAVSHLGSKDLDNPAELEIQAYWAHFVVVCRTEVGRLLVMVAELHKRVAVAVVELADVPVEVG